MAKITDPRLKNRATWIKSQGGKCVKCSSTEALELDHIDPRTKLHGPGDLWIKKTSGELRIYKSEAFALEELAKCQVLCKPCHIEKTVGEIGYKLLTQDQLDEIFRLRAVGQGSGSISKQTGLSEDRVWHILRGLRYAAQTQKYKHLYTKKPA